MLDSSVSPVLARGAVVTVAMASALLGCGSRTGLDALGGAIAGAVNAAPAGICPPTTSGQPIVLASGLNGPADIALDATDVYWINQGTWGGSDGSVMRVSVCGGPVTTLASGQSYPGGIAVDATFVYWMNGTASPTPAGPAIMRIAKSGGTPLALTPTLTDDFAPMAGFAVSSTSIYWGIGFRQNTIAAIPVGGGTPEAVVSGSGYVGAIAVNSANVYWTVPYYGTGAIQEAPLAPAGGGVVTTLASGLYVPRTLAVDSTSVYWTEAANDTGIPGNVVEMPLAGGVLLTLASNQVNPAGIALDGESVFWSNESAASIGNIVRTPKGGGAPTVVASGQFYPYDIVVDGTHAYWSNSGDGDSAGTIMKLAY